jgi:hypothetical protein
MLMINYAIKIIFQLLHPSKHAINMYNIVFELN